MSTQETFQKGRQVNVFFTAANPVLPSNYSLPKYDNSRKDTDSKTNNTQATPKTARQKFIIVLSFLTIVNFCLILLFDQYTADRPIALETRPQAPQWVQNEKRYQQLRKSLQPYLAPELSAVRVTTADKTIRYCMKKRYQKCRKYTPLRQHYKTCALVGNGGILLNSSCGKEIDENEFVIRFNLGPREGHTDDVGRKSNLSAINSALTRQFVKAMKDKEKLKRGFQTAKNTVVLHPGRSNLKQLRQMEKSLRSQKMNITIVMRISEASSKTIRSKLWQTLAKRQRHARVPTTGLLTLGMAFTICDRINIYGFYPFNQDQHNRTLPYHYWGKFKPTPERSPHNFPSEYHILQQLHRDRVVNHRTSRCNVVNAHRDKNTDTWWNLVF